VLKFSSLGLGIKGTLGGAGGHFPDFCDISEVSLRERKRECNCCMRMIMYYFQKCMISYNKICIYLSKSSWDVVIVIVTKLQLDDPWFKSWKVKRIFYSPNCPDWVSSLHSHQ
jgi:hypothetical protein